MSKIAEKQNTPEILRRLAAQSKLYSDAKLMQTGRLYISVALATAAPILVLFLPNSQNAMALVGGGWALITSIPFRNIQREKTRQAANIQELIDTELFDLRWNQVLAGSPIEPELINAAARSSKRKPESIRDWYSNTGALPYPLDVLLCQRSNVVWDWRLRRHFSAGVACLTGLVLIIDVAIALWLKQSLIKFLLSLFLPTLPVVMQGIETFLGHRETAAEKEELSHRIEGLWDIGLKELTAVPVEQLRQIQDRIYTLRKDGPLVPDSWYEWLKRGYQSDMDTSTHELSAQAERALRLKH